MPTDKGVHANQNCATNPRLGHARRGERIQKGKSRGCIVSLGRKDTTVLVLKESKAEREWVAGARVSYRLKAGE